MLSPQQYTAPLGVNPQVCVFAAASMVNVIAAETATGVARAEVESSPSCPEPLAPQQYATPAAVSPQAYSAPATRLTKATPPATGTGVVALSATEPFPNAPDPLVPQQYVRPDVIPQVRRSLVATDVQMAVGTGATVLEHAAVISAIERSDATARDRLVIGIGQFTHLVHSPPMDFLQDLVSLRRRSRGLRAAKARAALGAGAA